MKNKPGKYISYAISEIVLVVIGILIALRKNTWNEQRKSNLLLCLFQKNITYGLDQEIEQIWSSDRLI